MVRRSVLSVVLALSVGACDAFHAGPSLPLGLRAARGGHLCNAEMKASNKMGTPFQPPAAVAKAASSVLSGIVAASLILSPSIDVLSGPGQLSDGGVAHAQGATSRKSTRASPSTDANKDPESILRLSLPINEKNPIREAQVMEMTDLAVYLGKHPGFQTRSRSLTSFTLTHHSCSVLSLFRLSSR
jgi:hypothetical protein